MESRLPLSPAPEAHRAALITGASSGIGLELARVFAQQGYDVVLVARRIDRLQTLAQELQASYRIRACAIGADLGRREGAHEAWEQVQHLGWEIDCLVNDAGLGQVGPFAGSPLAAQLQTMDVNMRALVELTHLALPGMLARRRGAILNLGSTSAFLPGPGMAVYFASKAFVVSFSEALAHELKGTGVSATVVCPGPTATEFPRLAGSDRLALYQRAGIATPAEVAQHAYQAVQQGRPLSLHGRRTALRVQLLKFLPRFMTTALGARATRPVS